MSPRPSPARCVEGEDLSTPGYARSGAGGGGRLEAFQTALLDLTNGQALMEVLGPRRVTASGPVIGQQGWLAV